MADQIGPGVRVSAPPKVPADEQAPWSSWSVEVEFFAALTVLVSMFVVFVLVVPLFANTMDAEIAAVLLMVLSLLVCFAFIFVYIAPLRLLKQWLRAAQLDSFERVVPPPPSFGAVTYIEQELNATLSLLSQTRAHEQELLTHKSETITLIQHQLRTALTSLKWSLESFEMPPKAVEALVRVEGVIQQIIDAARIGEGTFGYVFSDTEVVPLVDKLITVWKPRANSRGVTLTFESGANIPHIAADADRLGIALENILGNAVEYTPRGGTVSIATTRAGEWVDITIVDNGIGMSQEDLANIYNKLYRGKGARRMQPDGSGLGLYIARNILNEHHAEIAVQSKEGAGTRFSIRLPTAIK